MRFLFRNFISKRTFTQKILELEKRISVLEASLTKAKTLNENQEDAESVNKNSNYISKVKKFLLIGVII